MSKRLARIRIQVILGTIVWLAVVGWFAIVQIPHEALLNRESPEVLDRMEVECTGSYQQRYDCKNNIAIEVANYALFQVSIRIALFVLGPIAAATYYGIQKRREPKPPPPPIVHDDMSWKDAAKNKVSGSTLKRPSDDDEPFSLDKL